MSAIPPADFFSSPRNGGTLPESGPEDRDGEEVEVKEVIEEGEPPGFTSFKYKAPFIYDFLLYHALAWPSYNCAW